MCRHSLLQIECHPLNQIQFTWNTRSVCYPDWYSLSLMFVRNELYSVMRCKECIGVIRWSQQTRIQILIISNLYPSIISDIFNALTDLCSSDLHKCVSQSINYCVFIVSWFRTAADLELQNPNPSSIGFISGLVGALNTKIWLA